MLDILESDDDDMETSEESAEDSVDGESVLSTKKKDKWGSRKKFFICAALDNNKKIILIPIEAENEDQAKTIFINDKSNPENKPVTSIASGSYGKGFYLVKNGTATSSRESVSVSTEDLHRHTEKSFSGVYKGFVVFGTCLKATKGYKDNELAKITFDDPVDKSNKLKKPKLKTQEVIPVELIQQVKFFG